MGVAYRAPDMTLGRNVARKVLLEKDCTECAVARRIADEARIAA